MQKIPTWRIITFTIAIAVSFILGADCTVAGGSKAQEVIPAGVYGTYDCYYGDEYKPDTLYSIASEDEMDYYIIGN